MQGDRGGPGGARKCPSVQGRTGARPTPVGAQIFPRCFGTASELTLPGVRREPRPQTPGVPRGAIPTLLPGTPPCEAPGRVGGEIWNRRAACPLLHPRSHGRCRACPLHSSAIRRCLARSYLCFSTCCTDCSYLPTCLPSRELLKAWGSFLVVSTSYSFSCTFWLR